MDTWKIMQATAAAAAVYYTAPEASSFTRYQNADLEEAAYRRALEIVEDEQLARIIATTVRMQHGKTVRADIEGAKRA